MPVLNRRCRTLSYRCYRTAADFGRTAADLDSHGAPVTAVGGKTETSEAMCDGLTQVKHENNLFDIYMTPSLSVSAYSISIKLHQRGLAGPDFGNPEHCHVTCSGERCSTLGKHVSRKSPDSMIALLSHIDFINLRL